jgi:hypothetical protein
MQNCHQSGPTQDQLQKRSFKFVPRFFFRVPVTEFETPGEPRGRKPVLGRGAKRKRRGMPPKAGLGSGKGKRQSADPDDEIDYDEDSLEQPSKKQCTPEDKRSTAPGA